MRIKECHGFQGRTLRLLQSFDVPKFCANASFFLPLNMRATLTLEKPLIYNSSALLILLVKPTKQTK